MRHPILLVSIFLLSTGCANQQNAPKPVSVVAPKVASPSTNGLDGDEEQAILSYHNEVRAGVNVPPLHWSSQLAQHSASWLATLATQGCELRHSKNSNYGENLFMSSSNQSHEAVIEAAKAWESEKINYSGEVLNKANWSQAGHYTQMVWRTSTELGCAKLACGGNTIVACNYSPAGNFMGKKPY